MAVDELQRILDANSNRIINVGTPTAANDATTTDNATNPAPVGGTAVPGSSFKAAAQDHAHVGVHSIHADANPNLVGDVQLASGTGVTLAQAGNVITVATSGGAVNKVTFAEDIMGYVDGASEQILREYLVNFDDAGGATIQARLSGIVKVAGGTGTYKLWVGATAPGSTTGGTTRATITTASTTDDMQTNLGAGFANPTGAKLVQITAVNSGANKSFLRGFSCSLG